MKKISRRNFLKVSSAAFAACAATACAADSSSASVAASSAASSEAAPTALADFPHVDSFNYYNISAGIDDAVFNDIPLTKDVQEYAGYTVNYTQMPAGTDGDTALMNAFMLKQDYQAVKASKIQFYTLLASDALLPITEYVNASEYLQDAISDLGWSTASKDGEIYGIPQRNPFAVNNVALAYRLDWLNEYNDANADAAIEVPSADNGYSMTVSDFKKMLEFFAPKVSGGGKAFAVDINDVAIASILPAFGVYQEWADVNGKLEYIINQPGFEAYCLYMKDLFDAGLVAYQATTADTGAVAALTARTTGVAKVPHWSALAVESASLEGDTDPSLYTDDAIGYIAALVPDDKTGAENVRTFGTGGWPYYTVIPRFASAEQAAAVVDYADKRLEPDFFKSMIVGAEGETFELKDGQYYPILPAFNDQLGYADKLLDGVREDEYGEYWLCRTRKTAAQDKLFGCANFNNAKTAIESPVSIMPPNEVFDNNFMACRTELTNYLIAWTFQKGATGSVADAKAAFDSVGGAEITDAVNEWYTAWDQKDTFNAVKPR